MPGACTAVAELDDAVAALRLVDVRSGDVVEDAAYESVTPEWCEEVARLLAPVRDAGATGGAAAIPARVSLLDLLGLPEPTPSAVAERWRTADGLSAPIGVAADGPFAIDAGQVEGLRMLLAGMPGTGKSELLQTLIGALAASHPPDPADVPARGLQGRRRVRRLRPAAAHRRAGDRPRRPARRPGAHRAPGRAAPARGAARRARGPRACASWPAAIPARRPRS